MVDEPSLAGRDTPQGDADSAPTDVRAEVKAYDQAADVGVWDGPRYRVTYRVLGDGPLLVVVPGIASTYRGYAETLNRLAARYRTVVYDYPGENPDDGADLGAITHDNLVDDVVGLCEHLKAGPAHLFGLSFGSTIVLRTAHLAPERFPKVAVQGAFAHRRFSVPERFALLVGRRVPGTIASLPFRGLVLKHHGRGEFPATEPDRWTHYVEQNGLTPIAPLAHRLDLIAQLDLRPVLSEIAAEFLLVQGDLDRIVPAQHTDALHAALRTSHLALMPGVGHQPHYTHAGTLAEIVGDWFQEPAVTIA